METLNKKYILQMEVLTPLHVGAGAEKDWVEGADFVVHENKVKILNLSKVANYVNVNDLSTALINKDGAALVKKLGVNIDKCVDKVFDCGFVGTNDIKTCIKNGLSNQPIVPGSSLKGAIRSILVDYLLNGSKTLNEQVLLGKASDGDEFMRFIKVSDAEFQTTNLINTKIFNLRSTTEGGWKNGGNNTTANFNASGFNTFYEVIEPKNNSIFNISIADKSFNNYSDKIKPFTGNKNKIINNEISFLFDIINNHTRKYLEKERAFFTKYATDKTDKIVSCIESLISQIPSNGKYCILKMAAGSGFHSITGDWKFDDYSIDRVFSEYTDKRTGQLKQKSRGNIKINGKFEESAKSRKIAILSDNELCLMGFVKLKPISDEEIQRIEAAKLQQKIELENQRKINEEIIAEQKRQEEAEKRQLAENRLRYAELLQEGQLLFEKNELDAAKLSIANAIELFPDEKAHYELNNQIERAISIWNQEQEAQKSMQALEQARIASNKIPLSEKIAKADKFPTIFGNVKTWIKLNDVQNLQGADLDVLTSKLIDVYSKMKPNEQKGWSELKKWSDLVKAIGEEVTAIVFNKVIH